MVIIRKRAYARAGLLGNPSDGYHGKTISFIVPQFLGRSRALRMGLSRNRAGRERSRPFQFGA